MKDGQFVELCGLGDTNAQQVIDATGLWVTPGFVDLHTHYDAEVEIAPALFESLKHGITSVFVGSCSPRFTRHT